MGEEPHPKIRIVMDEEPKAGVPVTMRVFMETPEDYEWPPNYTVLALYITPETDDIEVDYHFAVFRADEGEAGGATLTIIARSAGEYKVTIQVVAPLYSELLQVLEATIPVTSP